MPCRVGYDDAACHRMDHCIFCSIIAGNAPADVVYKGAGVLGIRDRFPQAPVHVLLLPRRHVASILELSEDDRETWLEMQRAIGTLANELGLVAGFRVVVNTGPQGGQTVYHLHLHLLGGRPMRWPPG